MPDNKYFAYAGTEPCFELVRKALGDVKGVLKSGSEWPMFNKEGLC
jgi:hypothetical protein